MARGCRGIPAVLALCAAAWSCAAGLLLERDQPFRVPPGWAHAGRVDAGQPVQLTFALRQRGAAQLARLVQAVSDPRSPRYGQYLSLEQLRDLVQPSPATLMTVLKWLQDHGVEDCRSVTTLDFLECYLPASTAERLLPGAEFHRYVQGQRSLVRSPLPYTVPAELAEHLDFVGGMHRFPTERKAGIGRQSPRVVPYPARGLCPGEPALQSAAVVSMGSADHRLNLAEILSQNYGVREEREEDDTQEKQKSLEELEKSFSASQSSEMPFEELLALYGYEASDPISEQDSESNDITPNLPDMTLDKEQIAKDLLSGEEEEETQSSADDLTPSVTSHDASDLFPNQPGSNNFLADEDKEPCSSPCASSMAEDSEVDSIPSNECKKEIMVGPQYQATVPILRLNRHRQKAYENEDQLLWDPNILPEREVEEFLYRAVKRQWDELSSSSLPEGEVVKDNEQALYELVKCNFNAEEALRRLRFNVKVIRDELCAWSEEECRNFEHGFRVHGKNFHLIQANKVRTRSVGECVEYYYMWKKSERYDYFTQQTRLGRKKYVLHPGATCVEYSHTKISNINLPVKIPAAKHLRLTDCAFFSRRFLGWEDGGMHGVFSEHRHSVGVGREDKRAVDFLVLFCVSKVVLFQTNTSTKGWGQGFRADFSERTQFDEVLGRELYKFKDVLISGGLEPELISL